MLEEILKSRKCFKLVCGAGNEDAAEVEKLVALYAAAGANYFDLSAREDVVTAAFSGLRRVVPAHRLGEYYLNVSVGIKGDPHVSKSRIDVANCTLCKKCQAVCLQNAIFVPKEQLSIKNVRCIGCGACTQACPQGAITTYSQTTPLAEVLPPLVDLGVHSIELHAISDDDEGIAEQWREINRYFDGMLSLCVDRSRLGDAQLIARIESLIEGRDCYTTILQTDGAPMSGCNDDCETTLQALATAQIVQRAQLPVYLMLSGGTNSKTAELAKLFNISAHGVALGSYARMIVREFIDRDDFFENGAVFDRALKVARSLVNSSLKFLG